MPLRVDLSSYITMEDLPSAVILRAFYFTLSSLNTKNNHCEYGGCFEKATGRMDLN